MYETTQTSGDIRFGPDDGAPGRPIDVRFGPGPTDYMPLPWAEQLITWLKADRPQVFADGMLHTLGIEKGRRNGHRDG